MSDFKVEFTLKQHTPLIHFQSEQAGATLRATELKPKFDRFLLKYAFGNDEKAYKKYLVTPEHKALDYKVKIVAHNNKVLKITHKSYFGNLGKNSPERKAVMASHVELHFFSYNKELISHIKAHMASFLAVENFGTRQSKGFGSFYLDPKDTHYISVKEALKKISQPYIYGCYEGADATVAFEAVEVIYPLMKTGINYPDLSKRTIYDKKMKRERKVVDFEGGRGVKASYYRSFLFRYMYEKYGVGNEKRFIKEHFFDPKLRIRENGKTKYYVRALLGTADGVTFRDLRKGTISYTHKEIKRFKSPITFKIVDACLYIIAHDNSMILDQTFIFSDSSNHKETIKTPPEFDLYDFLTAFANSFNMLTVDKIRNPFDKKILQAKQARLKPGEV